VVIRLLVLSLILGIVLAVGIVMLEYSRGANAIVDRDRDQLDDRLEAALARDHFPIVHEYGEKDGLKEECGAPAPRPVLFRARPRIVDGHVDHDYVAITYVLLYLEDCGLLGHAGDNEPFTVILHRSPMGEWQTVSGSAIAHQGTRNEQRSIGNGHAMWVTRNKHANYASYDVCAERDPALDLCASDGPPPPRVIFLNVGEPAAPLSNDVGDLLEAFRHHTIWNHDQFMEAGDITAELFMTPSTYRLPPDLAWDAEVDTLRAQPLIRP
jgi:hypothetical protein